MDNQRGGVLNSEVAQVPPELGTASRLGGTVRVVHRRLPQQAGGYQIIDGARQTLRHGSGRARRLPATVQRARVQGEPALQNNRQTRALVLSHACPERSRRVEGSAEHISDRGALE